MERRLDPVSAAARAAHANTQHQIDLAIANRRLRDRRTFQRKLMRWEENTVIFGQRHYALSTLRVVINIDHNDNSNPKTLCISTCQAIFAEERPLSIA